MFISAKSGSGGGLGVWEAPEKIASVSPLQKGHPPPKMRENRQFEERFSLSVLQESVCVLLAERYRL